ncbi:MAG: recombinase family protein [Actinomycetota bacterium]|nr:recombinase family protein [Actinomycetota bacterium]
MTSTNGHGLKTAVLYARVSTEEQARSGYSLEQQIVALRDYTAREGYEVLEEVTDPGHSGANLARPGMDRVRNLVAAGDVSMVLAQDRDRFAREPAYLYLLREEFANNGCKLRSLNDRGDDSPEGQLTDGILDQIARFERLKIAERSRRGLLEKARQGKVVATHRARFGFRFNSNKDGYELDPEKMAIVKEIFHMAGVERRPLHAIRRSLEEAGIATPTGKKYWCQGYIRNIVLDDIYRPHTYEEIKDLISPETADGLDPEGFYGIFWFDRKKVSKSPVSNDARNGKPYRYAYKISYRPKEEWIAIPVPDSGISREWVEAAREAIKNNHRTSSAGRRFWELSGGILRCSCCGCVMETTNIRNRGKNMYFYYRCSRRSRLGKEACPNGKNHRADQAESRVWEFVSGILKDPEKLEADLERMIEQERNGLRSGSGEEAEIWTKRLKECATQREKRLEQHVEGLITLDELKEKLNAIEESRKVAERELSRFKDLRAEISNLEKDKEALIESYANLVPEALDSLTPDERQQVYRMLRLRVMAHPDGTLEASGVPASDVSKSKITGW